MKAVKAFSFSVAAHALLLGLILFLVRLGGSEESTQQSQTYVEVFSTAGSAEKQEISNQAPAPIQTQADSFLSTFDSANKSGKPVSSSVSKENAGTDLSQGSSEAIALNSIDPVYPRLAFAKGEEGKVVMRAVISSEGKVLSLSVVESSKHPLLDRAAEMSLRSATFVAAKQAGVSIQSEKLFTFVFRIKNAPK